MHINTTDLVYLFSCAYIVSTIIILVYVTELNTTPLRAEKHSLGPPLLTFCTDYPDTGSKTGFDLVEDVSETMEISEYSTKEIFSDTGVRCFRPGLGSSMSRPENINRRICNVQETTLHIHCKELLAAWLGLQCYALSL